jgi:hypothetical protein
MNVWKPKVRKNPRLIVVKSQMDPVHIFTAVVLISSSGLRPVLLSVLAILSAHFILTVSGEGSDANVRKPSVT